jgi:hypothetical protein
MEDRRKKIINKRDTLDNLEGNKSRKTPSILTNKLREIDTHSIL